MSAGTLAAASGSASPPGTSSLTGIVIRSLRRMTVAETRQVFSVPISRVPLERSGRADSAVEQHERDDDKCVFDFASYGADSRCGKQHDFHVSAN